MIIAQFEFSLLELILLGVFLVVFIYQLWYYLYYINAVQAYNRKLKKSNIELKSSQPGVSVVICARDEADNLRKFLPYYLDQDYPDFEIIVVNDGSTDDTELLLTNMKEKYTKLRSTFCSLWGYQSEHQKIGTYAGDKSG